MAFSNSPDPRGTKKAALRSALGRSLRRGTCAPSHDSEPQTLGQHGLEQDAVNSIIEDEIVPALLSARQAGFADKSISPKTISPDRAREFARLPLHLETAGLIEEIQGLLDEGIPIEAVYDELLTPAARWLGEMWEQDSCDFVDVTMGLWRLQEVLHEISSNASFPSKMPSGHAKKAMFLPMPGEQHFMGPQILEDVFTRANWDATVLTKPRRKDVLALLREESFDLVGLTLSRDCPSAALRSVIRAMRSASRNPYVSILVGGHMINQNPKLVAEVGADGTGTDARSALMLAERLVKSAQLRVQMIR